MREEFIGTRIAQLRLQKGVSAREMSLSLGQNEAYINQIENGRVLPSMQGFFYICDYLNITPHQFFDEENKAPGQLESLVDKLKMLDPDVLAHVNALVAAIVKGQ